VAFLKVKRLTKHFYLDQQFLKTFLHIESNCSCAKNTLADQTIRY
jgi:hypothetical protein